MIIVGGSFSGVMAARELSHTGLNVLLIEQGTGLGEPFHTTGGVAKFWLEDMNVVPPKECYASAIKGVKLMTDVTENTWNFNKVIGYTLHPDKYMKWLSEPLDCSILLRTRVTDIFETKDGHVGVKTGSKYFTAKYVVAADGPNSIIARKCGMYERLHSDSEHIGMEYWIPNFREEIDKEIVTLHFSTVYAPKGYVWHFPAGEQVKVGLGIPTIMHKRPKERLDAYFKEQLKFEPQIENSHGGIIPTDQPVKNPVWKDKVFLAGDSAKWCSPLHGGGILFALAAGKYIGQSIRDNFLDNKRISKQYKKDIKWILKTLKMHYKMKKLIYSMDDHDFTEMIEILKGFEQKTSEPNTEIKRLGRYLIKKKPSWIFRILFR